MLGGEGNENGEKKNSRSLSLARKQLSMCSTLFCTFLCSCFARLQRETSRNFLVTRFTEEMSYLLISSCSLFFLPLIFTLVAARISHFLTATTKIFMLFFQQMTPYLALALCSFFPRWASLACRILSLLLCLSLSMFQIFGHDNWSKLN